MTVKELRDAIANADDSLEVFTRMDTWAYNLTGSVSVTKDGVWID